ncbi:chromosomal replication initiator protein DnaA, partial [Rhodovulum sulfidophilum]|uniref:DnaA N-terminal domain-containing protein n=1 Tax=Rhodovulum sulfidophilum TaxID=35806 RepID=UPI001A4928B9
MTDDTWGRIRDDLEKSIGKNNFVTWIAPLEFRALEDGVARFGVPTSFVGDWVNRNFGDKIIEHLARSGVEVDRLEFAVAAPKRVAPATAAAPDAAAAPARRAAAER